MNAQNSLAAVAAAACIAALAGAALPLPAAAQLPEKAPPSWEVPRTPWGDPDLQGTWPLDYINGTPVQRPPEFGERRVLSDEEYAERVERLRSLNARYDEEVENNRLDVGHWSEMGQPNRLTSLIVEPSDGRVPPMTDAGRIMADSISTTWDDIEFDGLEDFNALERCITRGLPASMFPFMYNSGIEIIQSPGYVVIRLELIHEARIVPIDGRPPLDSRIRQWMGESRGRWEGDTLVVETTNFNGGTPMLIVGPRGERFPTSETLRVVERLTRVGENRIDYEIEVEDPVVLSEPWKAAFPWKRNPDYEFFEYACHEGNTVIENAILGTRNQRQAQSR